jgi:Transposase DDE domain
VRSRAGIVDSQSAKGTRTSGTKGYDAGKKVKGTKRHLLVDTVGLLLCVVVQAANIQDRDGAKLVLAKARGSFPGLRLIWADGGFRDGQVDVVEAEAPPAAAPFEAALVAGAVDEDAAHGLGGGREEMPAGLPALAILSAHQAEIGFVDQGRGLKCLTALLLGQFLRCQLAQLAVNERQELLGGLGIALLDRGQDGGNIAHR